MDDIERVAAEVDERMALLCAALNERHPECDDALSVWHYGLYGWTLITTSIGDAPYWYGTGKTLSEAEANLFFGNNAEQGARITGATVAAGEVPA